VLAGFYVNELLLRLLPREDPHPELFRRYAVLLGELAGEPPLSWTLRRFERDLLDELGYGLMLDQDAQGAELHPEARYRYDPDLGPTALAGAGTGGASVSGAALLALAADAQPDPDRLAELRRMMRRVLLERLGGRGLHAWRTWPRFGAPPVPGDD
jgi:DNA repair protein RecO (recombination protein O)